MVQVEIQKKIYNWAKILGAWFFCTNGRSHLNDGCPVVEVSLDLMACVSELLVVLKGRDQKEALDRVDVSLRWYDLPDVAIAFRQKFKELRPPHSAVSFVQRNRQESPPAMPLKSDDHWVEPFACQKRSGSAVQPMIPQETLTSSKDSKHAPALRAPQRIVSMGSQGRFFTDESRASNDSVNRLLTVAGVATLLNVPRKWVYRRVVLKPPEGIPHVKMGKYLRFRESDLRTYLDRLRRN